MISDVNVVLCYVLSQYHFISLCAAEAVPLTATYDAMTELVLKQQLSVARAFKAVYIPFSYIFLILFSAKFLLKKLIIN
jgi:hypothetical protein